MSVSISEAVSAIKKAGAINTRISQMPGATIDGLHQIEIQSAPGVWTPVVTGLKRQMAENLIKEATNRVILG